LNRIYSRGSAGTVRVSDTEKLLTFRMPNLKKIKAFQSLLAFSKIPKA